MKLNAIMLPTLQCNASCDYCFVQPRTETLGLPLLERVFRRLDEYVQSRSVSELHLFWQGGEATLMGEDWFRRMAEMATRVLGGTRVSHHLQTNLLGFDERWADLAEDVFGGCLSTSLDYPNVHRRFDGRCTAYDDRVLEGIALARSRGLTVRAIALINQQTLAEGASAFFRYFVDEVGLPELQINLPYYDGRSARFPSSQRMAVEDVAQFLGDMVDLLVSSDSEVRIRPLSSFHDVFRGLQSGEIGCIWSPGCGDDFLCIGPRAQVSVCDCWVSGEYEDHMGTLLDSSVEQLLEGPIRKKIRSRLASIVKTRCGSCRFLALCFGGCPKRAQAFTGDLNRPDYYCEAYHRVFESLEAACPT